MRKLVLHLLSSHSYSGAENVVCQIMDMFLDDDEYEMVYCSPDGEIKDALKEKNISYVPMKKMSVHEVRNVINKMNPYIIHAHDMRAGTAAAAVCGKRTLVSHIHNNALKSQKLSVRSAVYLMAAMKSKKIIWVSQTALDGYYFQKIIRKKSTVLYNVINLNTLYHQRNKDIKSYDYDLVYLGRLTYQKNPLRLVRVLKMVTEKMPDTRIAIAGSGDLSGEVFRLIKEFRLTGSIDMLGFIKNPYKMLSDAKVMVMTSRWEGTPMCALEALALGTAVIAAPADGLKELIKDGYNGYLRKNDKELAGCICKVLSDQDLQKQMSENAVRFAVEYNSVSKYRSALTDIYKLG